MKKLPPRSLAFVIFSAWLSLFWFVPLSACSPHPSQDKPEPSVPSSPNRLAQESSPYLRQHAHNPVDWYPWGEEALERAHKEDKPIFLSVGYAACHWCHVMERESFEDPVTAAVMNEHFINIKLDREERPDIDSIYMNFVQMSTGHGGWPMSVFMTPDREPFYGGTYFPPSPRQGMPSFVQVLEEVARLWDNQRSDIKERAGRAAAMIPELEALEPSSELPGVERVAQALLQLKQSYDSEYGGFGRAPKFPHSMDVSLLLQASQTGQDEEALKMAEHTLRSMAQGGMYDQLGGGFHRYSVDDRWLVPHFEKMLYDNALLTGTYLDAYRVSGDEFYRSVVEDVIDFVLREMTHRHGGFFSTLDADSEGEEGKYYVWTQEELTKHLSPEQSRLLGAHYGVSDGGNFEAGTNIFHIEKPLSQVAKEMELSLEEASTILAEAREILIGVRNTRERPGLDDKILTSWNGLMIGAIARAGASLGRPDYLDAAIAAAGFVLEKMRDKERRLYRTWSDGEAKILAYLDDNAFFLRGLLDLYQATLDPRWIDHASALADHIIETHSDVEKGGFFFTSRDHESLIARLKDPYDGALPSGNGVMAMALLELSALTAEESYREQGEAAMKAVGGGMDRSPRAFSQFLAAIEGYRRGVVTVVIAGERKDPLTSQMLEMVRESPHLRTLLAWTDGVGAGQDSKLAGILTERKTKDGAPCAYVCRGFECLAPVHDLESLRTALNDVLTHQ